MPTSFNDNAIILRRFPYGEADMILVMFSRNHGKIKVSVKGSRKLLSRRGGHLDLFNHINVQIRESTGMGYLNEASAIDSFANSKNNLAKVRYYYYLAELVDALTAEEDKDYLLFDQLLKMFQFLDDHTLEELKLENTVREFEIFLLKILGHWSDDFHGQHYPPHPDGRKEFNKRLIEQIMERPIKTFATLKI